MEHKGSLPCSQEPATDANLSYMNLPLYFARIHSAYILPYMPRFFFRVLDQNFVQISGLSHPCYMHRQSHFP
jgi:hypothetical protein